MLSDYTFSSIVMIAGEGGFVADIVLIIGSGQPC
jgi:hypothetical protein